MNENEFEKQVEKEEREYTEPEQVEAEQTEEPEDNAGAVNEIVEKIKELVKKGNVTKIVIKKGDNVLVNIPLNVGIVGGIIGVAAAPWAIVAAAVATAGFSCRVELVKDDGEVAKVDFDDIGRKVKNVGTAVVDGIKDAVKSDEPEIEIIIEDEPAEEAPAEKAEEAPAEEAPAAEAPAEDTPAEE